ncbi:MAG: DUF402 domain-containing protein [Actinomycetota bacterium]
MTAMPMRVIADGPDLSVLHLAAETTFLAARAPDGGPVRDLADWRSVLATWVGGSFVRLLAAEHWYCVDVQFDANGEFAGYDINFQLPLLRGPDRFDTVDLVLDLVVAPDGTTVTKDLHDFERAVADGHLTVGVAGRVRSEAERLRRLCDDGSVPLGADEWTSWRPPPEWTVPRLSAAWHEVGPDRRSTPIDAGGTPS